MVKSNITGTLGSQAIYITQLPPHHFSPLSLSVGLSTSWAFVADDVILHDPNPELTLTPSPKTATITPVALSLVCSSADTSAILITLWHIYFITVTQSS